MTQTFEISWKTIIKMLVVGFALYVLYLAKDIVIWFLFALIISLLVDPVVNFLRKFKIPKIIAVILVYASIFAVLGLIVYLTYPLFVFEIKHFSENIPEYFNKINPILNIVGVEVAQSFDEFSKSILATLGDNSKNILKVVSAFFGGVASTAVIFTLAFFISLENKGLERVLVLFAPKKYEENIITLFEKAQNKVAGWFGARVLACIYVGVFSYAVFFILGVKYAFTLALIAGLLNFVPYVGPLVTYFLATGFAFIAGDWILAVYVFVGLMIVQETENKILSPLLMKKFMDLPAVLILMSLLVGATMFGFLGTVFAVPVFGIIYEFLKEFLESKREEVEPV
jgi:predicted PurR-regulated permease PerM